MARGDTAGGEPLLTRYLIYETPDEGVTMNLVGEEHARGSDEALRKYFAEPLAERDGFYAAVSENACRVKPIKAKVTTSIGDAKAILPKVPVPGEQASLA